MDTINYRSPTRSFTAAHSRLRSQIPSDVSRSLSQDQLERLLEAVAPQPGRHGLTLRASFRWITGSYYIALVCGRERRSDGRLRAEGHMIIPVGITVFIFMAALVIYGLIPLTLLLYLVKTALGLDLYDGPSALHAWICG